MASPYSTFSITAPGFFGLNTQDSSVDMSPNFGLEANNCVIDRFGRIGSRKGWIPVSDASADLGANVIGALGEAISASGVSTIIAAGNNKIFKLSGTSLVLLTYGGGGVEPTITANDWQTATLNGALVLFQEGHDPLLFDPSLSATEYRRLSEHPLYAGSVPSANCVLAAYGRLWAASTASDKSKVYWTDTLTYMKWTGGTAGSLDLYGIWPKGGDKIIAIAAHNGKLIIFGQRQILIYAGAENPENMQLEDSIMNSGCVGRDTVVNTPSDIIYLSDAGVGSIKRTIQEKSSPISFVSRNVNDDIASYVVATADPKTIKATYSPIDNFYLLTFTESSATYCFDNRSQLQDGSSRVTVWNRIEPNCYFYSTGLKKLLMGFLSYVGEHNGYRDNGARYRMTYFTPWIDFGDPIRTSILKKIRMTVFGATEDTAIVKWNFDYKTGSQEKPFVPDTGLPSEYNIAEYGVSEYVGGNIVNELSINASGSGKVIQIGFEMMVDGYPISIQRVDVFTKEGAYK